MLHTLQVNVALLVCLGASAVSAQASCDPYAGQLQCSDCDTPGDCATNGTFTAGTRCIVGQACMEDYGIAFCAPADRTKCNDCKLGSVFCDPYDPQRVVVCASGRAPIPVKTCDRGEICKEGTCVKSPNPSPEGCADVTGTTGVYKVNKPTCNSGVFCFNGEVAFPIQPCAAGEYFNPETGGCARLPVDLCDGKGDGLYSHMTDCTKTVVCQGGAWVMDIPCGEGELSIDDECQPSNNTTGCPALDGCTFETSGSIPGPTPTPPPPGPLPQTPACTPSNAGQRYPYEGDCKKYYTCRNVQRNTYVMIPSTCPAKLVFNPTTTYCDLPANVPSCVVSN